MNPDILSAVIFVLIAGLLLLLPFLVFPTLPFGVRIPLARAQDPAVTAERKHYLLRLGVLAGGLFLADIVLGSLAQRQMVRPLSIMVLIIGGWGVYYLSHRRLAQVKTSERWFADTRQAVAASATPRPPTPSRLLRVLLALPCAVLVVTVVIGAWRYSTLPANLQFVFPGNLGDWTVATTPVNAFLPVIFQGLFTFFLAGLAWSRDFGSQPIDVEDLAGSQRYQHLNTLTLQVLLLLLALGLNGAFLVAGLAGWGLLPVSRVLTEVLILAPLAGWLIVVPILLLRSRPNPRALSKTGDYVNRDDDHFWKLGVFYINRDDPAWLVPKRFGLGRTLNLGHPAAWVITLALVVFILVRLSTRFSRPLVLD
jgi:uncharacterized membrane protein